MILKYINSDEYTVSPFNSIVSVEKTLLDKGYVVVKDKSDYKGIVSIQDVIQWGHNLVVDCMTPKQSVTLNDKIETVLDCMTTYHQYVTPVMDVKNKYIGSITLDGIVRNMFLDYQVSSDVELHKTLSTSDIELLKEFILKDLHHNLKNPIQIILSSIKLIKASQSEDEKLSLLDSILINTKNIDDIFNLFIKDKIDDMISM